MTPDAASTWITTEATVTTCRYQFARMNTLTVGFSSGKQFRITFDYYAHGRLYSGEFQSPVAIPQNEEILIRYNPMKPEQNSLDSGSEFSTRGSLLTIGIAGSIILSLVWLAVLRGCS